MNVHERIEILERMHEELDKYEKEIKQDPAAKTGMQISRDMLTYKNKLTNLKLQIGLEMKQLGREVYSDNWTRARAVEDSYYLFLPAQINQIQNIEVKISY